MAELYVGLENNQKILIPTSSEARSGNPLGTILAIHSNAVPYGYLPCNGVAFDEHQYPALYALLGDNHTPYSYDKSRLGDWESITLSTNSASPTVMQFDGFITGKLGSEAPNYSYLYINGTAFTIIATADAVNYRFTMPVKKGDEVYIQLVGATSISDTFAAYYTHFNVIKATSGLEETQQDYVLQSLLEADSYSTEEVATGKKWIDGKMIYRKVLDETFNATTSDTLIPNTSGLNIDSIVSSKWYIPSEKMYLAVIKLSVQNGSLYIRGGIAVGNIHNLVTVEYTKAD